MRIFKFLVIFWLLMGCNPISPKENIEDKDFPTSLITLSHTKEKKDKYALKDSIKLIEFKSFKIQFNNYNPDFDMWYFPLIIKNGDTTLIKGLPEENGSELAINVSPNEKYFILDNIIKDSVENENEKKIIYENFTCVLINVETSIVEQSFQSECDGQWNDDNEWISGGKLVFSPK